MYSKVKILGHPVHPMLVAFPVAFYTFTFVAFVVFAISGARLWYELGTVVNWAGVITAAAAALAGFIDWRAIPEHSRAKGRGRRHMLLNSAAWVVFFINALIQSGQWNVPSPGATAGVLLSAVGLGLTIPAGFIGWTLVQKHFVGVDLTPEQERVEREMHDGHRPPPRPIREPRPPQRPDA